MKKAFIAAPLLGTIIFLASILFVVNLSKAEAGDTALIASDAYHNRIVSILEIYRTDLGSQFRENLSRVIEDFLTSQCWDNLFQVRNADDNGEQNDIKEIRRARCEHVSEVIHQVICSFSSQSDCSQYEQGSPEYNDCMAASGGKYGLPAWMGSISRPFTFEGVSFELSNPEQFEVFTNSQHEGYLVSCQALIDGSIFDCEAFSDPENENKFQCCSIIPEDEADPNYNLPCEQRISAKGETGEIVDGCEQGTFYVKVNVLDPYIYPNLPRVLSDDQTGNQVRSGAVGDDNFYLPINYPLFKYYDYALGAFSYLAYGEDAEYDENDAGYKESGVAEGFCAQGAGGDCELANGYEDDGFTAVGEPKEEANEQFYENAFKEACREYSTSEARFQAAGIQIDWDYAFPSNGDGLLDENELIAFQVCIGTCIGDEGWKSCTETLSEEYYDNNAFAIDIQECAEDEVEGAQCAFIGEYAGSAARMRFIDYDTSLQTSPNQRNQFCWRASPKHYVDSP
jgi:hypothetical protein